MVSRPAAPALAVLSLPRPFCPPEHQPPRVAALQHRFVQLNAPVVLQPRCDVEAGNGLLALFYHFDAAHAACVLSLVFESEASYNVHHPTTVNRLGTFFYRTHNYRTYHRTAVSSTAARTCAAEPQQLHPPPH